MELQIPDTILKQLKKVTKTDHIRETEFWDGSHTHKYSHNELSKEDVDFILEKAKAQDSTVCKRLVKKISLISQVTKKGVKHKDPEALTDALQKLIEDAPNGWVFKEDSKTHEMLPYLVTDVKYEPPRTSGDTYYPGYCQLSAIAIRRGDHETMTKTWRRSDLVGGKLPEEALQEEGLALETEDLVTGYKESLLLYDEYRRETGGQFLGSGLGVYSQVDEEHSWWTREQTIKLDLHGTSSRVVIDDTLGWKSDGNTAERLGGVKNRVRNKRDDVEEATEEEEAQRLSVIPVHPYVQVFSLLEHIYLTTHISNLSPYIYDRTLFDKVVFDRSKKALIDDLATSTAGPVDDIIAGKGQGVVILMSGPAGVGKTLSAETYSERAKKPLYTVQCSQLGTDPQQLEKELGLVLNRAERWGAILLIDEADVYIRARGGDLVQNAIVGVFLRMLEYYKGIIFMNTNRQDLIDDAILSRAVAHFKFGLPSESEAVALWQVLSDQFELKLPPAMITELAATFPKVSGRTIKQMIRLVKILCLKQELDPDVKLFKWAGQFQGQGGQEGQV